MASPVMNIPEQDFLFEPSKNCTEISSSRGQAFQMDNNLPPVLLVAFPGACHQIPVQKPSGEVQEAPFRTQSSVAGNPQKRNCYRFSKLQVNFLERSFKECPHPDHLKMNELGYALGMDPMKVKFWFEKKHKQLELELEHHQRVEYQARNDELRAECFKLKLAIVFGTCPKCGSKLVNRDTMASPEKLLIMENEKLRKEIKNMYCAIAKFGGNPMEAI